MKRAVVVLLLLIANILFASDQVTLPDSAPGKLLSEWLTAYNAADAIALREFAEKRYSPEARGGRSAEEIAEGQIDGRRSSGGLDLLKIENSSPTELVVILKARSVFPRLNRLALKVGEHNASLLIERKSTVIPPPPEELTSGKSIEDFSREVDTSFAELGKRDQFSGAALIAKDGQAIWQNAYGLQDREKKVPANFETRFRIGSMDKMFTSVAIAQLVEAGKLKFDDKLATVLPDYPNKDVAQKITVAQLLTHTAGVGDIFGPAFFRTKDSLREIKDYLPLFVDQPLRFEPGLKWSYSNGGFIVLGLIIEKVSGQNYYDYVEQHIFAPAGMKNTGSTPKNDRPENLAVGYMHASDGNLEANWDSLPWRGMSAGGGESTVGDLLRFANALRSYKLLSREQTELITAGKVETQIGAGSKYAYGFGERIANGRRSVGHSGGAPGMNAALNILWDEGYAVVVLSNLDPTVAQDAADYITDRLPAATSVARP